MKRTVAVATLLALVLAAGAAPAQEKSGVVPLAKFVSIFTDPLSTSAQKEVGLPVGTWYEGAITVSDVEHFPAKGKAPAYSEIKDWNYAGGCYLLLFRTSDLAGALKLKVGERILVRARLADFGINITKFTVGCETRFAHFRECAILGPASAAK